MSELGELLDDWNEFDSPGLEMECPALAGFKDVTSVVVEGIYVLLLGIIIVYVGQAKCLAVRIGQHREDKKIKFDSVKIFPCAHKGRRLAIEKSLIKRFTPKYNIRHNEFNKQESLKRERPANVIPLHELMAKRGLSVVRPSVAPMLRRI